MQNYSVDSKRIYVGGLSAGGAAAAIMGTTHAAHDSPHFGGLRWA
jgi:poly(3-hydroxybutyrate) depolymerase